MHYIIILIYKYIIIHMNIIELILYIILYQGAIVQSLKLCESGFELFSYLPFENLYFRKSKFFSMV